MQASNAVITLPTTQTHIVNNVTDNATEMTWDAFADYVNNGVDYSGKTIYLDEDITATRTVGVNGTNCFNGTFDGQGHTLTFNYTTTAWYMAPFRFLNGATVKNLKVDGTINCNERCGGFVGECYGDVTFTNCVSDITINSSKVGDGTHGGFVSVVRDGTTTFNGCAFTGRLLGSETNRCSGFVGWIPATAEAVNFNDCLFAPKEITMDHTNCASFMRGSCNISNCYHTYDFNNGTNFTYQGFSAFTITVLSPGTATMTGTPTVYDVSQITTYEGNGGILHEGVIVGGANQGIYLTLDGCDRFWTDDASLSHMGNHQYILYGNGNAIIYPLIGVPYSTDFESGCDLALLNGGLDNAWTWGTAASNGGSLYISNDGGVSNAYTNTNPATVYACRSFHLESGFYIISYDWICHGERDYDYLRVALVPNYVFSGTEGSTDAPSDFSNQSLPNYWIALDGGTQLNQSYSWQTLSLEFELTTSGDYMLVFIWRDDISYGNNPPAAIDNVSLRANTCLAPANLTVSSIGPNAAGLSWTGAAEIESYTVKYKATYNSEWLTAPAAGGSYQVNATLSGLTPNTPYQVMVYPDCDPTEVSETISFTTVLPASLPYSTDFESGNDWTFLNSSKSNAWVYGTGAGGNTHSIYISDDGSTYNFNNENNACIVYATKTFFFETPGLYHFQYKWKCNGGTNADFLRVVLVPGSTLLYASDDDHHPDGLYNALPEGWIPLDDGSQLNHSSSWQTMGHEIEFEAEDVGYYTMAFVWVNNFFGGENPPAAIDDVSIEITNCAMPTNLHYTELTATTAQLSWTENDGATVWQLCMGDDEANPITVTDNHYTLTDLRPQTEYTFKVRSLHEECESYWSNTFRFTTTCDVINFPWVEDFNTFDLNTQDISCWQQVWWDDAPLYKNFIVGCHYGDSSCRHLELDDTNLSGTNFFSQIAMPQMEIPAGEEYSLTFDVKRYAFIHHVDMYLVASPEIVHVLPPDDLNGATVLAQIPLDYDQSNDLIPAEETEGYYTYTVPITVTGTCYISIVVSGLNTQLPFISMDNFKVSMSHPAPTNLFVSPSGSNGIPELTWNPQGNETQWILQYSTSPNFSSDMTQKTASGIPSSYLTGLKHETKYYIRVKAFFGGEESSGWSDCITYETPSNVVTSNEDSNWDSSHSLPFRGAYAYSISQQIYTAEELGDAGTITAIAFRKVDGYFCGKRPIRIFMISTSQNSYGSILDWIEVTGNDCVFSNSELEPITVTFDWGWNTITFTKPFEYDGESNVAIVVDEDYADFWNNGQEFSDFLIHNTEGGLNQSLFSIADGQDPADNYDATIISSVIINNSLVIKPYKNVIQITKTYPIPTVHCTGVTTTGATIFWAEHGTAEAWQISINDEETNLIDVDNTQYVITDLEPGTTYTVKVRSLNDGDNHSDWSNTISFTTDAAIHTKTIESFGNGDGNWRLIASPIAGNITPNENNAFTTNEFDLYRFNQSSPKEWKNWKQKGYDYHFNIENSKGYLYANKTGTTLRFEGTYNHDGLIPLDYNPNAQLKGWNLIGNPFPMEAILNMPFYRMNASGTELSPQVEANNIVEVMEGVFVKATAAGQYAYFTPVSSGNAKTTKAVHINLNSNEGKTIDNAIIRFDGGQTLDKFSLNDDNAKIFIPQGDTDYAIVSAGASGELPLGFKVVETGTYTLSFSKTEVEFSDLHLIDKLTGADIDLLAQPSYSFEATTTDDASRFTLVFVTADDLPVDDNSTVNFTTSTPMPFRDIVATPCIPSHEINSHQSAHDCNAYSQTVTLGTGWGWFSSFVEYTDETLGLLQAGIAANSSSGMIKSSGSGFVSYAGGAWTGSLTELHNEEMYLVSSQGAELTLSGIPVNPAAHPITLNGGWSWIGFLSPNAMTVTEAMAGITPNTNDMVKGQDGFATYNGDSWMPEITMVPGQGYLYKRNGEGTTLVYPSTSKGVIETAPVETYWNADRHAFPTNLSMMVTLDESVFGMAEGSYEVGAFVDGECRGSARLMNVDGRYIAFLTVSGEDAENVSFRLYDVTTGSVYGSANESIRYKSDDIYGSIDDPMVLHFRNTGLDELDGAVSLLPNPAKDKVLVSGNGIQSLKVYNAMGQLLHAEECANAEQVTLNLGGYSAGVYTVSIVTGNGQTVNKILLKK
ncbi:MAG: fibronectin type III domain-containing protein [Bacteroidales bacterium]|nr:fibronectin type III domain-containing protein [Bacteroidales bacterium]